MSAAPSPKGGQRPDVSERPTVTALEDLLGPRFPGYSELSWQELVGRRYRFDPRADSELLWRLWPYIESSPVMKRGGHFRIQRDAPPALRMALVANLRLELTLGEPTPQLRAEFGFPETPLLSTTLLTGLDRTPEAEVPYRLQRAVQEMLGRVDQRLGLVAGQPDRSRLARDLSGPEDRPDVSRFSSSGGRLAGGKRRDDRTEVALPAVLDLLLLWNGRRGFPEDDWRDGELRLLRGDVEVGDRRAAMDRVRGQRGIRHRLATDAALAAERRDLRHGFETMLELAAVLGASRWRQVLSIDGNDDTARANRTVAVGLVDRVLDPTSQTTSALLARWYGEQVGRDLPHYRRELSLVDDYLALDGVEREDG